MLRPVGFLSRLFAKRPETPQGALAPDPLELERIKLRLEKLELERPAFVAELESMLEACQEVLARAESKRARAAAIESKRTRAEEQPEAELDQSDPAAIKANVRRLLRAQGKIA